MPSANRFSSIVFRSKTKTIAAPVAIAASILALSYNDKKRKKQKNQKDKDDKSGNNYVLTKEQIPSLINTINNPHYQNQLLNTLKSINEIKKCHCDSNIQNPPRKILSIRSLERKLTIQGIQTFLSRSSVQSKYDVDFDAPPLGEGGFGSVYLATDKKTGEKVALKKIDKKLTDNDTFLKEMRALLHIKAYGGHPHISALREYFEEGDYYYLILDLVSGGEMFDHLVAVGAYSEADAARLLREVASALAFLHGIGVVHGDLKPENLMLSTPKASDCVIKVVDFGCADVLQIMEDYYDYLMQDFDYRDVMLLREAQKAMAKEVVDVNTPAYSAPEVIQGARKQPTAGEFC